MSNALAIAAVTETLRGLLMRGVGISDVTASPLDNARRSTTGNQINLFLYQVLPNAAWRNQPIPRQAKAGETGSPPLALTLSYLITAYSSDENDMISHALLGNAMRVFHDHAMLNRTDIAEVTSPVDATATSDLKNYCEQMRITLQPLTFDEMSKLWTTFQTHYRVSAAYQVSVVLIESTRPLKTPLPVLQRGEGDRGVASQPDLTLSFPIVQSVQLPERRLNAQPGNIIVLTGTRLSRTTARLSSLRLPNPPQPATQTISDTQLQVTLPANLAAGFYTLAVTLDTAKGTIASNELSLGVAPVISPPLPRTVTRAGGKATIDLACSVEVLLEQCVSLLLGDYEVQAEPPTNPPPVTRSNFQFVVQPLPDGTFPVPLGTALITRLRIDGVDSEILAPRGANEPETVPLTFDTSRTITIN